MKIFVAGATGILGRRAVRLLVGAGHDVTGVARSDAKAKLMSDLGATPARVDIFDADAVRAAAAGFDVVMNLATHIPSAAKLVLMSAWKENDRIRTIGSKNLVDAAIAGGARRCVQESIAFVYEERDGAWLDEDAPRDLTAHAKSVGDAEREAARFTASGGAGVVLRFGQFYCADSDQTQLQLTMARRGLSTYFGDPGAYMPPIHLDDAASAVVASLTAPAGAFNVVDDTPMRRADGDDVLASMVGRKHLRRIPKSLIKLGGAPAQLLARSQRVSNRRFKDATGWEPSFPSLREGLAQVVEARR